MTDGTTDMTGPDELLAEVLARYDAAPDPRMREVMQAAIRHLHAFVREVGLTRDEWMAGIQFLTATGQICSETRQEFILMSDTLGVSTLVEMLNYSPTEGTTENTVLGPFYAPGSPERAKGESMLDDEDAGDKVVVRGRITDPDGTPLAGVVLDCWQSNTDGFYTVQQIDGQSEFNLRGVYRTDANGEYEIRTVRPGKYPIPHDGPVGALLKANNRGWMRPGHLHTWVKHPGYKELITHIFDRKSDHLYDDAVFGVRESLIVDFTPDEQNELSATFDFVLDPA
jgi:protocatechuate 3,4-dioxygenase beta subunit